MDIFTILIIAISLSIDTFTVSLANGIILKKVNIYTIMRFALFFGFFQFFMTIIGYFFGFSFSLLLDKYSRHIGFTLLFFLGFRMFFESFRYKDEKKKVFQSDKEILKLSNMIILSIATSIDALIVGISLATFNAPLILSSTIIGITSFILSAIGIIIGKNISKMFNLNSERVCGIVLVLIAIKILFLN